MRESGSRRKWLATIVRREAFRQHSRIRPSPIPTIDTERGADDERVLATAERADLHAALTRLTERERLLLRLRYEEDLTQETIAKRLSIPVGTVKVRLHRARAKLRRYVKVPY